jgi:hypothetical protein
VPDCPEHGKPHEYVVSRATLYEMFDPDGSESDILLPSVRKTI